MSAEPIHDDTDPDVLEVIVDDDGKTVEPEAKAEADPAEPQDSEEAIRVASLMGWKGKEHWKGDPTNWRSAESFLAEVPEVMRNTRKKNDRIESQLNRIVGEVAKLSKNQRQQRDADLDAALDAAIDAGDKDEAKRIRDEIRATADTPVSDTPPELSDFEARNASWLGVDPVATEMVKALDRQFASAPGATDAEGRIKEPAKHLKRIEDTIRKRFPEHFEEPAKEEPKPKGAPPALGRGTRTPGAPRGDGAMTIADMTPNQRSAARTMGVSDADWVKNYNKYASNERRAS
jgi:hypothetical protein